MLVTGWADGYTNIALRGFSALECPKRLIAGPWAHASTETSRPGPNVDLVPEMARWWDRWLRGIWNGVEDDPPIVLFVRRPTPPDPELAEHRGEWRFEPGWPLERCRERTLELSASSANRPGDGPDELAIRGDVGWTAWISCAGELPWGQPQDQRPDEAASLVYDWPSLEDELEILGHPRALVRVTSSVPVAYLSAKLCDVHPDGTSQLVTRGLLNLAHRESREAPSALAPGEPVDVAIELEVTSWVFEPGHRVRLDLASSDWPNAWPPPRPGSLLVDRERSRLVMPTLEGRGPIERRPELPPPRPGHGEPSPAGEAVMWHIEHDVTGRQAGAVVAYGGESEADEVAPHIVQRYGGTVGVSMADPGRAFVDAGVTYELRFPEARVQTASALRIDSDAEAYQVRIDLEAREGDELVWSRRWERRIPRNLQ
jgi:predicted acyl esterase